MYLNTFAQGSDPLDMTGSDEFRSLLASAGDLGIPHAPNVPYRSCNIVVWPSCPQACIRPGFWLAYGRPDASRIGSASMSARSPTASWPLPLRNTPTTPVLPTPR